MALVMSSPAEQEVKVLVSQSFFKGVQELERFVEVLQNQTIYSELTLAEVEQVANKLRPHVNQAFNEFSNANEIAMAENARVSREIESNVAQQHQIQCTIRTIEGEEAELQIKVDAIKMNLEDATKQVKDARDSCSAAESTLRSASDDLDNKRKEQAIAFAFPIGGWIVALTVFEDAVKGARKAVDSAEENVQDRERNLREKKQELEYRETELNSKKREREDKLRELNHQQKELELKKQTQKQVLDMSERLKYLVTAISTTRGRTKVLREEFECIYSLDTLHQPLRELGTHFQSDTMQKSRLLSGELDLVSSIKKFRMICDTAAASTEDDYY